MALRQNPGLKGKPRRIRSHGDELTVLRDHADGILQLLPNHVTVDATLFVNVVLLRALKLFHSVLGNDGQRDQLRVRMFEGGSGCLSIILEQQNVFEAAVSLEVDDAVAKGP